VAAHERHRNVAAVHRSVEALKHLDARLVLGSEKRDPVVLIEIDELRPGLGRSETGGAHHATVSRPTGA
jgi:hypothetical protein